jgi:carbohydrate-selective porin OprB
MLRSGFVLACLAASAAAQSPDPTNTEPPENGVKAGATYDGETVSGLSGGAKRGTLYHGSLQAQAALDLERLFGWTDTTAFFYGMWLHGGDPETVLELTYLVQVSKSIALQPDLQYIVHPNTDPALKDALAFLLRFEISF